MGANGLQRPTTHFGYFGGVFDDAPQYALGSLGVAGAETDNLC